MTREVITAGEDAPLEDISTLILKHQKKRIPIVRDGGVVGIVSRTDLVKAMPSHGPPVTRPVPRPPDNDETLRQQVAAAVQKLNIASIDEDRACELAATKVPGITGVMSHMQVVAPHLR